MKKNSLVYGLLPALTLGVCSTGFAQALPETAAPTAAEVQAAQESAVGTAAVEPMTDEQAIEELRTKLAAKIQSTRELKKRLTEKLDTLDDRIIKAEKNSWEPRVQVWGYGRLRHDAHSFDGLKTVDDNYMRLNLFTTYRIDKGWTIRNETEFDNDLTFNTGAYEGEASYDHDRGGKRYARNILQLYAEGRVGEVDVKLGRYFGESPYKFTFDEKVDGIQLKWGKQMRWGRANLTLNAGNIFSKTFVADPDNTINRSDVGGDGKVKLFSLMGQLPVMKNTNLVSHYGKIIHRENNDMTRSTFALGFDTKITPELTFYAATAKSDAANLNRSHFMQLKYKEANPAVPGSYGFYAKKYLHRGHTGLSKWFMDDLASGATDFTTRVAKENNLSEDYVKNNFRAGEFNGLLLGAEFVPTRNTKLKMEYTFGNLGLINDMGESTGKKQRYNMFSAQMEFYF